MQPPPAAEKKDGSASTAVAERDTAVAGTKTETQTTSDREWANLPRVRPFSQRAISESSSADAQASTSTASTAVAEMARRWCGSVAELKAAGRWHDGGGRWHDGNEWRLIEWTGNGWRLQHPKHGEYDGTISMDDPDDIVAASAAVAGPDPASISDAAGHSIAGDKPNRPPPSLPPQCAAARRLPAVADQLEAGKGEGKGSGDRVSIEEPPGSSGEQQDGSAGGEQDDSFGEEQDGSSDEERPPDLTPSNDQTRHWRDCACEKFRPWFQAECECGNAAYWRRDYEQPPPPGFRLSRYRSSLALRQFLAS